MTEPLATRVDAPTGREVRRAPWWDPRLALEGLTVFLLGLVAAVWQVPALQDGRQAVYDDLMTQAMGPDRHGLARMVKDGFFPSWTRYQFTGEPYAANTQHETLYPGSLPFLLVRTSTAMDVVIAVHIALAFLGMWAFLRLALRTSRWAAVLGAVGFGLSSQILGHITLGDQLHVLAWTPWVFLGTHLALERGRLRHVVLMGLAVGLQFLAGHPEEWIYSLTSAAMYTACWVLGSGPRRNLGRRLLHATLRAGGGIAVFVGLFSWALLPALLLKGQGFRNSGFTDQFPVPVDRGVNTLLPDYGKVLFGENLGYASVIALALFALFLAAGRGRVWLRAFLAVNAAIGFTFALGTKSKHPQLYDVLYDHVSLIAQFRVPSRWLLLTCFSLVVGSALGLDTMLAHTTVRDRARQAALAVAALAGVFLFAFLLADSNNDGRSYGRWALAAAAGAVVFAAAQVRQVPRVALAVVVIAVAGLEAHQARPQAEYRQKAPNALYDDYGPVAQRVADAGGRYLSIAGDPLPNSDQRGRVGIPASVPREGNAPNYYLAGEAAKLDLRPNNHIAVGAEALNGRDNGLAPFGRYKDFFDNATGVGGNLGSSRLPGSAACAYAPAVATPGCPVALPAGSPGQGPSVVPGYRWDALDLMGLEWVAANERLPAADQAALRAHGFAPDLTAAYVQLWRRPTPPLFRLLHEVDVVPARADRVARLQAGYPFATRAMVEKPVRVEPAGPGVESVTDTRVGQTSVSTQVTVTARSLVELSDPYFPQWQVTVDGHPAEMLAVDHAFRGVVVDAGTHTVVYRYVDRRLQLGLLLAGLTTLGLALAGLLPAARRRRRGVPVPATRPAAEAGAGDTAV